MFCAGSFRFIFKVNYLTWRLFFLKLDLNHFLGMFFVPFKNIQQRAKIKKPKQVSIMKKIILAGITGVFILGMTSCGGGQHCDAYRTSDYTKYKAEQSKKIELDIRKK